MPLSVNVIVALFKTLNFDEGRILNCNLESLLSWVSLLATKFASKCHLDSNSIKKVFLSGTQSQLIKSESLKYVPRGAII